ncbi:DUF1579 family protein [Pseudarthrobacter sp. H3Y2-7]|uniref:DUF1579 family protein n=1 Tax=Pseudarthrobacter naphthalenicus TaxID=3031328 RepID=UPI0023AF4136|nr:DUF1579 family protein [Pseudarthrobacter sp. H3Y2-7]MDE8670057.1 DUF1579 family protein [Pseudarthrobacter sp. H3Y2-7]
MTHPQPGTVHAVLEDFLGRWRGTTRIAASAWAPEHTASAEVNYTRAAGGYAVVQSYRHTEPDGSHFEGHGVFTVDPDHNDVLWYYVDSLGQTPAAPSRCMWQDGVLRVERRSDRGTARHTFRVDDGVLTHTAELRFGDSAGFIPFMTSECRRA